jgi:hypothetical protein
MALFTATPGRRRTAMIALLTLAVTGGVIRKFAPDPSTLRDIGTLLLVLWLPAVGNLIAWFIKRIPRSVPPATEFAPGAVFTPQLQVSVERTELAAEASMEPDASAVVVLVGRRGFVARVGEPLVRLLAVRGEQQVMLELLHPDGALPQLTAGTEFHLLVGTAAVAKGRVLGSPPPSGG